jgi:hypothetical protein
LDVGKSALEFSFVRQMLLGVDFLGGGVGHCPLYLYSER